jgi:hypothetical protein
MNEGEEQGHRVGVVADRERIRPDRRDVETPAAGELGLQWAFVSSFPPTDTHFPIMVLVQLPASWR